MNKTRSPNQPENSSKKQESSPKKSVKLIKNTKNQTHGAHRPLSQPHVKPTARPEHRKIRVVLKKKTSNPNAPNNRPDFNKQRANTIRDTQSVKLKSDSNNFAPPPSADAFAKDSSHAHRKDNRPERSNNYRDKGNKNRHTPQRGYNYKEFIRSKKLEQQQSKKGIAESGLAGTTHVAPKSIDLVGAVTVSELARKMNIKGATLVSKLVSMGIMAQLNEKIDTDTATLVAAEYDCKVRFISIYDATELSTVNQERAELLPRPPVVTIMGHVDHGKTQLLDTIRSTNVVAEESGGITQHIAAYQISLKDEQITFIDTPGHEAFTLMRARGAQVTDIVVLVVAADDGVMPQTLEAIDHAKAAQVPMIVAINKIDLEGSNIEQIKQKLSDSGLVPEEWGGKTIVCPISALKKDGIPDLLDAILVNAHELALTAPQNCLAIGKILESRVDHGRGIVCTVLVEQGTLRTGDSFLAGVYSGKVRALFNDRGQAIDSALPATPVEVLGFTEIPNAGDPFQVAESEREAKTVGAKRQELKKIEQARSVKKIGVEDILSTIDLQSQKTCKVILKGDVHGSVEAIKVGLERLDVEDVRLEVIRSAVGDINENDVLLASASDAIVIAFHVRAPSRVQRLADREIVAIKKYSVIYHVIEDMNKYLIGLQNPEFEEVLLGEGQVRNIFTLSRVGTIAGSYITKGKVKRNCIVALIRDDKTIHRGVISTLKRFKDDVKEVEAGYECGILIDNFNDIVEGDVFQVFEEQIVEKT